MPPTVSSHMRADVTTVSSSDTVVDLERILTAEGIGGVPVVDDGALVGVVSRSDIVRRMAVEQSRAEMVSDFYRDPDWTGQGDHGEDVAEIGAMAGQQLQGLHVRDIMSSQIIATTPAATLQQAAALLLEHRIHRVPVTEDGRLRGILSTQDLVRFVANG